MEACLTQIFRYQFFHADLHPGNLLILENNIVGFVDFGLCDVLDNSVRANQLRYLTAVYNDDAALMFKALTEILIAGEFANSEGFRRDFLNVRRRLEGRIDESEQPAGDYLSSVLNAARRNGYKIPTSILSIYRALLTAESVAAQLGLADGIRKVGRKFFTELQSQELYSQLFDRNQLQQIFVSLLNLTRDTPRQLNQVLSDLVDGTLSLKVEVGEDPRITRSRKQRARMQVCAVLSVGVAILLTVPNPPIFFGVPIQRVLTFLLLGLYVAVFYFWRQL
jgi:ubiquinone biosynthesis protein